MHKGRPYPFHPDYWSTEAWFWRGFVPWKMHFVEIYPDTTLLACLPDPSMVLSEPGEPSPNRKQITYTFDLVGGCFTNQIVVTMERVGVFGAYLAQWTCQTTYWDLSIETQVLTQDYPQFEVLSPVFTFHVPPVEVGPPIVEHGRFYPATYAEGGSPWPRVPEGPPLFVDLSDITP